LRIGKIHVLPTGDKGSELEAELNAKAAARRAAWTTSITEAFRFPARGPESETLSLLSRILGTFAQDVRNAAAAINDPDTQRDELMLIARNLDTLRGALGYPDVPATLHHIVEQLSGATAEGGSCCFHGGAIMTTLQTMEDARTELRRLLADQMEATPRGTVVPTPEIIAAFQELQLTDSLRSEIFETGVATILRDVINPS
jgi:hypothetical protein